MLARLARVAALDSEQRRRKRPNRRARAAVGQGMARAQRSLPLSAYLRSASLPMRVPWEVLLPSMPLTGGDAERGE
jgi:hypothetical protein